MNENHEKAKNTDVDNEKIPGFDRTRDMKKPYETPQLTKLGDVAMLTNVSMHV